MKLYMHPVSNTQQAGAHVHRRQPSSGRGGGRRSDDRRASPGALYLAQPNRQVPTLVDGDLTLGESSAILKYLAEKFDLAAYPKDAKKRAKVNEMMDWFNTHFYHDYAYGVVSPQVFPHHKRPSEELQKGTIAWAEGAHQEVAAGAERQHPRQRQQIPDRQRHDDRRLFWRGSAHLGRFHPAPSSRPTRTSRHGWTEWRKRRAGPSATKPSGVFATISRSSSSRRSDSTLHAATCVPLPLRGGLGRVAPSLRLRSHFSELTSTSSLRSSFDRIN